MKFLKYHQRSFNLIVTKKHAIFGAQKLTDKIQIIHLEITNLRRRRDTPSNLEKAWEELYMIELQIQLIRFDIIKSMKKECYHWRKYFYVNS